jgi:hypothetical protein
LISTISAWDVWRNYHVHRSLFVYGSQRGLLIPQPLPRSSYLDYINWQLLQPIPSPSFVPGAVKDAENRVQMNEAIRQHHHTQLLLQHVILSIQRDYIHQLTNHRTGIAILSAASSSTSTGEVKQPHVEEKKKKDVSYGLTFARAIHDIMMVVYI